MSRADKFTQTYHLNHNLAKRFFTVLILYMGFFCQITTKAQDNPYKIDNECYKYMQRIRKSMHTNKAEAMCDTMIAMAEKRKDAKAKCVAMNLKSTHWLNQKNIKVVDEFPRIRAYIETTPYHQYIYSIWKNVSIYYDKCKKTSKSIETLNEMRLYAISKKEDIGIAQAYAQIGSLYYAMGNYSNALYNYKQAYEIMSRSKDSNLYDLESKIGQCYLANHNEEEALIWMKKSIEHAPEVLRYSPYNYYVNLMESVKGYPVEEYYKGVEELKRIYYKYPPITLASRNNFYQAMSRYSSRKGNMKEALMYSDSIEDGVTRIARKANIYYNAGLGDSAAMYLNRQLLMERETWQADNRRLLMEMTAANDSSELAQRAQRLVITQLQEREKLLQAQKEKALLEITNKDLEIRNRKNLLLTEQQKAALTKTENRANLLELARQKERNERLVREHELEKHRTAGLIAVIIVIVISAISILYIMKKNNARLKREKKIVEEAKQEEERQRHLAEQAMKKAQKADELKSLFLQNMSHEIRTPLNAIVGFSEILNGEEGAYLEANEREEFLDLIKTNSTLLTTLINDILDMSKLESGTYKLEFTDVDVDVVCRTAVASVEGRNKSGVSLGYIPCKLPIMLHTDISRLQQVIINFLTNACKNTEEGKITLTCESVSIDGKDFARFAVTDTGCGVPADKAETIFKRFEKLDDFKQGTGLGLSIVMLICELLHGKVYLDTEYKNGARFVFEHPLN